MEVEYTSFSEILSVKLCDSLKLLTISDVNLWSQTVKQNIRDYIESEQQEDEFNKTRPTEILSVAVSSLQKFIQMNWLGPPCEDFKSFYLPPEFTSAEKLKHWQQYVMESLSADGEDVYSKAEHLELLLLSKIILLECRDLLTECQVADLWLLRSLRIQQDLYEERSPGLMALVVEVIQDLTKKEPLMTDDKFRDIQVQFQLEAGYLMYFYYKYKEGADHFKTAAKLLELQVELTGVLGKRTKYQENATSQLILLVKRLTELEQQTEDEGSKSNDLNVSELPNNALMDDDTVLDEVNLSEEVEHSKTAVSAVEQAVILGLLHHHRKSHANVEDILREESMAFLSFLIGQPKNWCIQTSVLLKRTQWDKESARRMVRCLTQLEELVNLNKKPKPAVEKRWPLFYSSDLPPKWDMERKLGNFMMKIGAHSSALEVFLRIELWDDIIKCYAALGRTEKAEKVIREQLSIEETPTLLCYLGDVTNEPEHYTKAWDLSKGKSSRAQRNLGYHYLRKCEFEQSIPHFEKSLVVNSLQIGVWFSYGCACMGCSKFDLATKAFRKCVQLDQQNFEAWNNLATSYVNTKQKSKAFAALQEAVKCSYENWRIWENMLLVGTDVGEFSEVIQAYHRLIDLKDKYVDTEVLKILVRSVNEDISDVKGRPGSRLQTKVQELFGRITSKVTTDAKVWRLYAELLHGSNEMSQETKERALQYLQKSHRCSVQTPNWEKDIEKVKTVALESSELAEAYLKCVNSVSEAGKAIQLLSSARLMIKGVATKVKCHTDPVTKELNVQLTDVYQQLEQKLKDIETVIEQTKS